MSSSSNDSSYSSDQSIDRYGQIHSGADGTFMTNRRIKSQNNQMENKITDSPSKRKYDEESDTDNSIKNKSSDEGSVLVIILKCETKECDPNISNLKWIFSDPFFVVQVCEIDNPPNIPTSKTLLKMQYLENYRMKMALEYASEGPYLINENGDKEPQFQWRDIPVIIVKDGSVSNITGGGRSDSKHNNPKDDIIGGMKQRISISLEKAENADLFFLCKWDDACDKHIDVKHRSGTNFNSINHGSSLKWSSKPTATQAIMYRPASRDYIKDLLKVSTITLSDLLNLSISQGNLSATVFVPNIIDFDINIATSNEDYYKLNECAPVQANNNNNNGSSHLAWFAVVIIIMILTAWFLIQLNGSMTS